ncbi:PAS domain S-box protein [Salinarimonas soli]|nr:PAS domain S-box protein [Salinarimonas soli]
MRWHLGALALALTLPILLFAGLLGAQFVSAERMRLAQEAEETAQSVAAVLDREFAGLRAVVDTVALSRRLQDEDWAGFHAEASEIRDRIGRHIVVRDLTGQHLVNTRQARGAPLPRAPLLPADLEAIAKRRPVVSNLFIGAVTGEPATEVVAPVLRGEEVTHLVNLNIPAADIRALVAGQTTLQNWTTEVVDGNGLVVARSHDHEAAVGKPASPVLRERAGANRLFAGRFSDGGDALYAVAQTSTAPWTVAVSTSREVLEAPLVRALWILGSLGVGLMALALGATWLVSRHLVEPTRALVSSAAALARGEPVPPMSSGVTEINRVSHAFAAASIAVRERRLADERAAAAAQRIQTIFESITDSVIVLDRRGRFTYLNERARSQIGPGRDLVGLPIQEAFPHLVGTPFWTAYQRAVDTGGPQRVDAYYAPRDIWFDATAYPSAEGLTIYFRDVTAERRAAVAVRESEERLRLALDAGELGTWDYDLSTGEGLWSERTCAILGYEAGEVRALAEWQDFIHRDDRARVLAGFRLALEGEADFGEEYRIVRPDGEERWVSANGLIRRSAGGEPVRAIGILHDVTERRRADEELRRTTELLRAVGETTPDAIMVKDREGRLLLANPATLRVVGKTWDEVRGRTQFEVRDDAAEAAAIAAIDMRVMERGEPETIEETVTTPYGLRTFLSSKSPLRDAEGRVYGLVGIATDITDRKAREAELAAANQRLEIAQSAGGIGVFDWNPVTDVSTVSPAYRALYGWAPDVPVDFDTWLARVHSDDREAARRDSERALAEGDYASEYRILRPDGEERWIHARGVVTFDETGRPVRMVGVNLDITERKHAEDQKTLMVRELHHRVKNTLATVQAIANATARNATDIESFRQSFTARIISLARTHTLLTENAWGVIPLRDLLDTELAPYEEEAGRVVREGPAILLPSDVALAFGMAVHELTTNAAKHGALSTPTGRLVVRWALDETDATRRLRFSWVERGGPVTSPPKRKGFGSRLLQHMLAGQLKGDVLMDYAPEGLTFSIDIALAEPQAGAPASPLRRSA